MVMGPELDALSLCIGIFFVVDVICPTACGVVHILVQYLDVIELLWLWTEWWNGRIAVQEQSWVGWFNCWVEGNTNCIHL